MVGVVLMVQERQPAPVLLYGICALGSAAVSQPVGLRPRFLMLAFPVVIALGHPLRGPDPPVAGGRLGGPAGRLHGPGARLTGGVPVILDVPAGAASDEPVATAGAPNRPATASGARTDAPGGP